MQEFNHIFLLKEGIWEASGIFSDTNENIARANGAIEIKHSPDLWNCNSLIIVEDEEIKELRFARSIIPFNKKMNISQFTGDFTNLEKLNGRFICEKDYFISVFQSKDGQLTGTEYFNRFGKSSYKNRGVIFDETKKLFSWSFNIKLT
jgi:CMP-2-keto-3-deoxyoctulosonic acid synthetase